ncbi:hypothetical protein DPEC_G00201640 [Dallia pectoralis]|uniref:Uncharacterized protein n=1 Tax=Dallia pectoralis TaxID=75939 RepID=A0ACC2G915_DALPE|nr:hypothetical protein DPEC_G00201640 [Dallia pectoralis]
MLLVPSFLILILVCPALLTQSGSQNLQTGGATRDSKHEGGRQPIKVISETCFQGDSSLTQSRELDLEPGSPLVLTHRIRLIPGSGGGGCEAEFSTLRDRVERLEKEVSVLREKCGGPEGGCCNSQQSKDCMRCESGFTGVDCGTAMSGVSQLSTKDITESSVTLFWTPPPVQYDTYHLTFISQKEGDPQITSQVGGKLTTYTQTGLAAGHEYTVVVKGEKDGRMGADGRAEFTTLISGPANLHVVKTSTTFAVVQWEQSHGDIDRYRLSVKPHQADSTAKGRQELTVPPERNSAQIDGLDPGHLYDITLVAEKRIMKSLPATVQVTPGEFYCIL